MISLYRPGRSVLHRLPAGAKLIGLFVLAIALSVIPHTLVSVGVMLGAVFVLYLTAGFGPTVFVRQIWSAKWIVLVLAGTLLIFASVSVAVINTGRVIAVILLAALVTMTTMTTDLLSALERALGPLRRVGVSPERVGLTLVLTIAIIPVITDLAMRVREAQQARGVRLGFRFILPLTVLALRHADDVGDALSARGLA